MTLSKLRQQTIPQLFVIFTRYLVGSAFVFASIVKIAGQRFTSDSGENNPINSAWHFFETLYQSGIYWKFLGLAQLVAGFLLMTQRFSKLGAVVFLPIIANVFVITISYDFRGTPIITGLMLLANIMLLVWDKNQLSIFWNQIPKIEPQNRLENHVGWQYVGLLLFFFVTTNKVGVKAIGMPIWAAIALAIVLFGGIITYRKYKRSKHQVISLS